MEVEEEKKVVEKFLTSRHAALSDKTAPSLKTEGRTTNNYIWTADNTDPLADAIGARLDGAKEH